MENYSNLFKKERMGELVLTIVFIIYLILGLQIPQPVATIVDTLFGKITLFIIVIYLFIYSNPILAIISLFVAFDLIRRSSKTIEFQKYTPSEKKKSSQFTAYNQFPYTLEQEIVSKMAPTINSGTSITQASYKPIIDNLYDASPINI